MIFRMDTDAVRAMAARFRSTAEAMETSLTAINQGVKGAPWQSQAREEFVTQLELLQSGTLRSAEVLRMMAGAAEEKASQWEAIGNIFNGPFQALSGLWNRLKDNMGWLWGRIKGAITGIRLPSIPKIVLPVIAFGGIAGWFQKIIPDWKWPPSWWPPFKPKPSEGDSSGGKKEEGDKDESGAKTPSTTTPGETDSGNKVPVEPVGLDQDDPRWGDEVMGKNGRTIDNAGCLITSVAMMARLKGADVNPADVNNYMRSHGGYDGNTSNMYWGSGEKYLESALGVDVTHKTVQSTSLEKILSAGNPVMLHVGSGDDGHWVLATGIDSKGNYIVYESSTGKQSSYSPSQLHKDNDHHAYIIED